MGSLLQELDLVLTYKKQTPTFSMDIIQSVRNYSMCVLPVKTILKSLLKESPIYVYFGKRKNDPYQFYFLNKVEKGLKYWNMDCRMINFCSEFSSILTPYLIAVFKKNYHEIFKDNVFRSNFVESLLGLELECKQILQNLIVIGNFKRFVNMAQKIITESNRQTIKQVDKLNLSADDPLSQISPDDNSISNVINLFENCDKTTAEQIVNSVVIY